MLEIVLFQFLLLFKTQYLTFVMFEIFPFEGLATYHTLDLEFLA